nr:MAG TPA: 50S ribosomal subunit [Caudoviricetes sp.]DAY19582.1 MAG TPA: 50S ribosomal subunit [Caudoviricetes sp.]
MENKVDQTAKNEYSNIPPKFYCEFCGSELLEDGRCPVDDCVHNIILDVLAEDEESTGD